MANLYPITFDIPYYRLNRLNEEMRITTNDKAVVPSVGFTTTPQMKHSIPKIIIPSLASAVQKNLLCMLEYVCGRINTVKQQIKDYTKLISSHRVMELCTINSL